jgi:hypothetical protein
MPHVRKQEYKKASDDYRLKYVEIVSPKHALAWRAMSNLGRSIVIISEPPMPAILSQ